MASSVIECGIFRNEGQVQSSLLLQQAENIAAARWPGERMFTYVDPEQIKSTNPGYCYKVNGWNKCGKSKKDLIILEKQSNQNYA